MPPSETKRSIQDSYRLLAAAQKSSVGVSLYSRWVNRPIGRLVASVAHQLGLTPNAVTGISALLSLAGVVMVAVPQPSPLTGVAAGLLLILGFGFDSADGQLARLRNETSLRGEWLDHMVDSAKMVLVHMSVLIAAVRFYDTPLWWTAVPLAFLLVAVVQFSGVLITQFLLARRDAGTAARRPSTLRSVALLPADYGILATSFLLSGVPTVFVPVYSALAALSAVLTAALIVQWWHRLG